MIESADLEAIDTEYFDIVESRDYTVLIHSKNTGHDWHLLERIANGHRSFLISHRHSVLHPYHLQKSKPSISACCEYIMDHDAYHLKKNKGKKVKQEKRRKQLGLTS